MKTWLKPITNDDLWEDLSIHAADTRSLINIGPWESKAFRLVARAPKASAVASTVTDAADEPEVDPETTTNDRRAAGHANADTEGQSSAPSPPIARGW